MKLYYAFSTGLLASHSILAAQLTKVNYPSDAASKAKMYIYIPDNVVPNPPVVVVIHSCQLSAQSYFRYSQVVPWHRGSDAKGYITVWPSSPNKGSCWDVSSNATLVRDGGGDSQAISNMIKYAVAQYQADASRVFVTGGSSGAMMGNVLAATYPDQIAAVSLYSGVAAGCFASASDKIAAWNSSCSQGKSVASAQAWGDIARAMCPASSFSAAAAAAACGPGPGSPGPLPLPRRRPKMQFWHGSADTIVAPQNYQEELKQWTNVFGVSQTPTASRPDTPQANYVTSDFGPNVQGIFATGVGHSVHDNLAVSEAWFGL